MYRYVCFEIRLFIGSKFTFITLKWLFPPYASLRVTSAATFEMKSNHIHHTSVQCTLKFGPQIGAVIKACNFSVHNLI